MSDPGKPEPDPENPCVIDPPVEAPAVPEPPKHAIFRPSDDPYECRFKPFPRPGEGDALYWYANTPPIMYKPYLVRVVCNEPARLTFVFLDKSTGQDVHQGTCSVDRGNVNHVLDTDPSSAIYVEQCSVDDPNPFDCGFLFLTNDYIDSLPGLIHKNLVPGQPAAVDLYAVAGGDGKTPRGAGVPVMAMRDLLTALQALPTAEREYLLKELLTP